MKVFFDDMSGNNLFSMKLDFSDTVLEMKQKIERYCGYSVSSQTIFFKGKALIGTHDNHTLQQRAIVNNSRLQFHAPRKRTRTFNYMNQAGHQQTEQSSVPFRGIFYTQDSSVMVGNSSKNQVLHQTKQSQVPSSWIKDVINIDDSNQVRHQQTEQSRAIFKVQDSAVMVGSSSKNQVPSNSMKDVVNIEKYRDLTVMASRRNEDHQGFHQTQQFTSVPSSSMGGIFGDEEQPSSEEHFSNIQSFEPQTLRIMILPHSPDGKPTKEIVVDVNANDNGEELRRELVKIPELNLPEEYFFIRKDKGGFLDEDKSFRDNGVAEGDTLEIFPGYISKGSTSTRFRAFGH